ncbi:MAG TPA: ATP-binding protein [Frankiaceae bacterium]|nr:ATP-binding protein [Frankiaceae bacterium]
MPTVELRFTALPAHVRTARLLAAVVARRAGVDEGVIDEVKLAVGEACARAVGLHASHAAAEDVVVELNDDDGCFTVTVRDRGPAHADTAVEATGEPVAEPPDLIDFHDIADPSDPGAALPAGFGLAVVAGLVDNVEVVTTDGGTAVRMTWQPTPAE